MSPAEERIAAGRLLHGLEAGAMSADDAAHVAEELDPVLVHAIVSYLRAVYPASDPAATSVLDRVVRLTSASPELIRKHKAGAEDPITGWLESEYEYRDFKGKGDEMIALIVDKIDS